MIEKIIFDSIEYAMIIRPDENASGVKFVTDDSAPLQVGFLNHPTGHKIIPHLHKPATRTIKKSQEVLVMKRGSLKVNFYNFDKEFVGERILNKDDIILLMDGGHGFEVLEECEIVEVKQGPYLGVNDKERF